MDAFFASVEQRDNPDLIGKPVAVGGGEVRGVVAAASYEARKFGVRSAMPGSRASRLCPTLIFVKPRFDVYKSVSNVIREIFYTFTDLVEPLSLDEAYLDVTMNKQQMQSATQVAERIREEIFRQTSLTASAGVSVNKFLAKIASDMNKPNGIFVIPPGKVAAFIKTLPIEKFFGVGKVTAEKMKAKGIFTGGDLQRFDKIQLVRDFGKVGGYFYDVARGIDHREVKPDRERKSLGAERTFDTDYSSLDPLLEQLEAICRSVDRRVKKANVAGKTVTIKVKFKDFRQITRSKTFDHGVREFNEIETAARKLLIDTFDATMKIRLLGVTLSNFEKEENGQITLEF